jgi:hypothetical protein
LRINQQIISKEDIISSQAYQIKIIDTKIMGKKDIIIEEDHPKIHAWKNV